MGMSDMCHLPCIPGLVSMFDTRAGRVEFVLSLLRHRGASDSEIFECFSWLESLGMLEHPVMMEELPDVNPCYQLDCAAICKELGRNMVCFTCSCSEFPDANADAETEENLLAYIMIRMLADDCNPISRLLSSGISATVFFPSGYPSACSRYTRIGNLWFLVFSALASLNLRHERPSMDTLECMITQFDHTLDGATLPGIGAYIAGDLRDAGYYPYLKKLYQDCIDENYNAERINAYMKRFKVRFFAKDVNAPISQLRKKNLSNDALSFLDSMGLTEELSPEDEVVTSQTDTFFRDDESVEVTSSFKEEPPVSEEKEAVSSEEPSEQPSEALPERIEIPVENSSPALDFGESTPNFEPILPPVLPIDESVYLEEEEESDGDISPVVSVTTDRMIDLSQRSATYGGLIMPLCQVGLPSEDGEVWVDGLLSPYLSKDDDFVTAEDLKLDRYRLAFLLEGCDMYAVEYAIFGTEEGLLISVPRETKPIFIGVNSDCFVTLRNSFYRSGVKVCMFSAPIYDLLLRYAADKLRGLVSLYDTILLLGSAEFLDVPKVESLPKAVCWYCDYYKKLLSGDQISPADLKKSKELAKFYARSNYTYLLDRDRKPHLTHNGKRYKLRFDTESKMQSGYVKVTVKLTNEAPATTIERCYAYCIERLALDDCGPLHNVTLLSDNADTGLVYAVPLMSLSWSQTSIFLWLSMEWRKMTNSQASIYESYSL